MEDIYYSSADGEHTVHAVIWRPEGRPRAVLQIIHGMEEYAARYAPFAYAAAERGILVCAEDHLGHGLTAGNGELGHFPKGGAELVLSDIRTLTLRAKQLAPDAPVIIMGHSMGSFFCRVYISRYGSELAGAVVMGTGFKDGFTLAAGSALSFMLGGIYGRTKKSKLIEKMAFGAYNKRFSPERTPYDWLSAENGNVDRYVADELCGFGFTYGGYSGLFDIMKKACSKKTFAATPEKLPLFIVSGEDDPVGDYGKGVKKVYSMYKKAGLDPVLKIYSGARHEVLNDFCGMQASEDLFAFFADCVPELQ